MTNEEAKQHIEHQEVLDQEIDIDSLALDMAVVALEKQIPKKPHSITFSDVGQVELLPVGFCPNCRFGVEAGMNYCNYCGQALDWTKRKE